MSWEWGENGEKKRSGEEGKESEDESGKLNDQLTGFVKTKLAGGIEGDGGKGADGSLWARGGHKQIINTVSLKGRQKYEDVTRVLILCLYALSCGCAQLTLTHTIYSTHGTCKHVFWSIYSKSQDASVLCLASLWYAGLVWFAVIKLPPVKFKQVFVIV